MKSPRYLSLLLSAFILAATTSSAQSVTSDVVGYTTKTLNTGVSLTSFPLIKAPAFSGTLAADSVNGTVITVGATLSGDSSYYLHVTSGSAEGSFESITASDATTVTIEAAIAGLAAGDNVRIVEHNTLSDLTEASGNSIPDNTTVTIYNSDGSADTYTIFSGTWYDSGFGSANDVIVFPGEGVAVGMPSSANLTFAGTVNTESYAVELTSGVVNILSSLNPTSPTGYTALGAALGSLADNSTVTAYSEDGALSGDTYTLFSGVYYDAAFSAATINPAAPSAVVVSPSASGTISLAPAL